MTSFLRIFCVTLFCWPAIGASLHGQSIKGQVTDANGQAIGFVSLFVKEMKQGTIANENGYYEISTPPGNYTCVFQCLGYETETRNVAVGQTTAATDITMREIAYKIAEVVVYNNKEDLAYNIMRRAIAMAPYYKNQTSEFKADVYLKGSIRVDKISRLVKRLAKDDLENIKEGNTYLEESYNEIEFAAPNKYKQKVLKKTGSMPGSEGETAMQLITSSVYDPEELLPIISPLSSSAFAHYRFRYEGYIEEGNRMIYRIKITPTHKSKQLLSGYICIADKFWNVHSVDVKGEFVMGIDFRMQVNFGEVNENIWLPVSHRFDFDASVLGNKASFLYVSSVKYTHVKENTSLRKPDALLSAEQQRGALQQNETTPIKPTPRSKTSEKIEKLAEKEDLSNREAYKLAKLMQKEADAEKNKNKTKSESLNLSETLYDDYKTTVDSAANLRDTVFWEQMRPVPLMPDELKSYREKETRELLYPPQTAKKDTTERKTKSESPFIKTSKKILLGTDIKLGEKGGHLTYRGLEPSKLGFNTVDGFFVGQKITYYKDFAKEKSKNRLSITPQAVWAVNRKTLMWDVNASFSYAPLKRGNAVLLFGRKTTDFNESQTIYPFENTIASLFFRRNYLKLYDNSFVHARNSIDIVNGLQMNTKIQYARRIIPDNHSDYSFFYRNRREYSPNIPENAELIYPLSDHTSTSFTIGINYTPRLYYRIDRNNRKRPMKSVFPTVSVGWQKGVKTLFGSSADFDHLSAGILQNIETGLMQRFGYTVRTGMFVNHKNVYFSDFKHFSTVEIPVTTGNITTGTFNLLEYYRYATSDKYAEAHLLFNTPFLILKYLPFFNNRLWSESVMLNYLYTPHIKNYFEAGYSIGLFWQAGIFVGFENFKYRSFGVKLSFPIS